jgi:predicted aldo/keto reductase-like oxidoreductase
MADKRLNRRDFVCMGIVGSGATLAGVSSGEVPKPGEKPPPPKILYRTLGRTKLKVSEVGLGSYGFSQSDVFNAALDAGINFVQTSADYQQGNAEKALGKILAKRRKEAVVATGWTLRPNATKQQILEDLDKSLERLQCKDIDIMLAHMSNSLAQVQNPAILEAFDEARKAKKVSFLGVSSHGGEIGKVLDYAAESDKFDVLICKYNFMEAETKGVEAMIEKAGKKKLGVAAFKAGAGSRELAEFKDKGLTEEQATVRWVLKNPNVASVLRLFGKFEDVKSALEIMSKRFGPQEAAMLDRYKEAFWSDYCRYCGECDGLCPYGVAISKVMRYAMYFKHYGREKDSMALYATLAPGGRATPCTRCPGHCEKGCPYDVKVRSQLVEAHELLTLRA